MYRYSCVLGRTSFPTGLESDICSKFGKFVSHETATALRSHEEKAEAVATEEAQGAKT